MYIVNNSFGTVWVPVKPSATLYVGGLVGVDISAASEGVEMLPVPSGVANATNKDIPHGIIIGTNRKEPVYDSTNMCEYITSPAAADAHDGASIEYFGVEGPWAKGDPVPMVKVDLINPMSVIRAPIYATAVGTAPALLTCTVAGASGVTGTFNATDFTPTNDCDCTLYFRTGNNAGAYRVMDGTSTTELTWDIATRNDVEVGCTAVAVPIRTHGPSTIYFHATTMSWVDADVEPAIAGTNLWSVNVIELNLAEAGKEYVDFMFHANHFTVFVTPDAA